MCSNAWLTLSGQHCQQFESILYSVYKSYPCGSSTEKRCRTQLTGIIFLLIKRGIIKFYCPIKWSKICSVCGKKDCPDSERRIPDKWNKINYKKNLFQNKIVRKLELRISESPLYLIHNTVKVSHVKKKTVHKFTTDLTTNDAWRRMHARNKKSIAQDHPIHLSFFKLNINVTLY